MSSQSLHYTSDVLVIGAGPAGLASALSLAHYGCSVIVVDDEPRANSNSSSTAGAILPRTLELLHELACAHPLTDNGLPLHVIDVYDEGDLAARLDFSTLPTTFQFALFIQVTHIERILLERLHPFGVTVLRPRRLIGLQSTLGTIEASFEGGEKIRCRYVIGADGPSSKVREICHIPFLHPRSNYDSGFDLDPPLKMSLADITFSPASHRNNIEVYLSASGPFVWAPIAPSTVRVIGTSPGDQTPPRIPTVDYVQSLLRRASTNYDGVKVHNVLSGSRFRIQARIAARFAVPVRHVGGAIFLVGDAAHLHSPAGAQGLDLALREGCLLGCAIRRHMDTGNYQELIAFARARRAVALDAMTLAEQAAFVASTSDGWKRWLLHRVAWSAWNIPWIRNQAVMRLSGLMDR